MKITARHLSRLRHYHYYSKNLSSTPYMMLYSLLHRTKINALTKIASHFSQSHFHTPYTPFRMIPNRQRTSQPLRASHQHTTFRASRNFTAIRCLS